MRAKLLKNKQLNKFCLKFIWFSLNDNIKKPQFGFLLVC